MMVVAERSNTYNNEALDDLKTAVMIYDVRAPIETHNENFVPANLAARFFSACS